MIKIYKEVSIVIVNRKMPKEVSLADIMKMIEEYEVVELEDVKIKGDVEIELGTVIAPAIIQALQQQQQLQAREEAAPELVEASFEVGKAEWNGEIEEVTIGATSADGGTRERTVTIGAVSYTHLTLPTICSV